MSPLVNTKLTKHLKTGKQVYAERQRTPLFSSFGLLQEHICSKVESQNKKNLNVIINTFQPIKKEILLTN